MHAYKSLIPYGLHFPSSSSSQPSLSFGANTKIAATPKTSPMAERPGAMNEISLTPSTSFKPVKAKMVIPREAAAVRHIASKTTPGAPACEASEILAIQTLKKTLKAKRRA